MYGWGSSTICNILEKREYLGHTINFKTRKHFKDKKSHYVPEDGWTIFENTHEPLLTSRPLTLCRKSVGMSDATRTAGAKQLPSQACFFCADCGGKMYVHRTNNGNAYFSIYLFPIQQSPSWKALHDTAPYQ